MTLGREGPLLVEGPVEVTLDDGSVVSSQRFTVAICLCRRSRSYPWCDTSHRSRTRTTRQEEQAADDAGRREAGRTDGEGNER